ncbi:OmpA family protein [Rhodoferax saidenbachensis]|uniref:Peptidoglycan-associated lipoprotein n=1 Tax=Rhodoferax saidenbachensis TaxID=1484693 RepID=A0A1P8KE27_9BURK|nr:OmpA family protein [Rhodoferax saidenbachensis]APW44259.1 hypothetical protein RS694_18155 [Rhodoferax saidenbachensis]
MKSLHRVGYALGICTTIFLGACSSTPMDASSVNASAAAGTATTASPAMAAVTSSPAAKSPLAPHADPASLLFQKRSVYFDFEQSNVKAEYTPLLEMHGKYLAANPGLAVRVEGNTDEQGGAEYNLALGQKRAAAVVAALKIYGARDAQLEAVSWGEEKPKATGHDEAAYQMNRRADLAYPAK